MPKNLSERKYREEVNITVNINNNNKSYNIFNKNQDNIKNNDTQDINIEDNNLKKKYKCKYELTHFIKNKDSIYPKLKVCLSETTRLEDIFN